MARVYNLKADFHRLRETLLLPILLAIIDALIYMRLISITKRRILNRKIRWREIRFAPRFLVEESTITFVYLHTSGRCPGGSGYNISSRGNWAEQRKPRVSSLLHSTASFVILSPFRQCCITHNFAFGLPSISLMYTDYFICSYRLEQYY